MLEYLKVLEPVLLVALGWAFGLLTPAITERIRRGYRAKDLTDSIVDELANLQYTMAALAWTVRAYYGDTSDAFIDRILPFIEAYRGPNRTDGMAETMARLRAVPQQVREAAHLQYRAKQGPTAGINIPHYSLPLFVAQISDLAICSFAFQRAILHVRFHLDLLNQSSTYLQALFDKSYANPNPTDLTAIRANTETTHRAVANRAETIIEAINGVRAAAAK
jgi:hypothetical protein